jgi:peroxidase
MREHNRIAAEFRELNPTWIDENIFQETKRVVIAEYQNIIYSEWLPIIGFFLSKFFKTIK